MLRCRVDIAELAVLLSTIQLLCLQCHREKTRLWQNAKADKSESGLSLRRKLIEGLVTRLKLERGSVNWVAQETWLKNGFVRLDRLDGTGSIAISANEVLVLKALVATALPLSGSFSFLLCPRVLGIDNGIKWNGMELSQSDLT
jgi:hypothetical protein